MVNDSRLRAKVSEDRSDLETMVPGGEGPRVSLSCDKLMGNYRRRSIELQHMFRAHGRSQRALLACPKLTTHRAVGKQRLLSVQQQKAIMSSLSQKDRTDAQAVGLLEFMDRSTQASTAQEQEAKTKKSNKIIVIPKATLDGLGPPPTPPPPQPAPGTTTLPIRGWEADSTRSPCTLR